MRSLRPAPSRGLVVALGLAVSVVLVSATASSGAGSGQGTTTKTASAVTAAARPPRPSYVPPVKHVFVINFENKGYDETWGDASKAPYLADTLRRQ